MNPLPPPLSTHYPRKSLSGPYLRTGLALLIGSAALLAVAGVLAAYSWSMFQNDMADGTDNGGAETAGWVFMLSLFPCVGAVILFALGIVFLVYEAARRR